MKKQQTNKRKTKQTNNNKKATHAILSPSGMHVLKNNKLHVLGDPQTVDLTWGTLQRHLSRNWLSKLNGTF